MIEELKSPVDKQLFIWKAEYNNGDIFTEFNNDKTENNFNDINKDILDKFGLIGGGLGFSYDTYNGVFDILGDKFGFKIEFEDKDINLTGVKGQKYNDIITYKNFVCDILLGSGKQKVMSPSEFYFGYKTTIKSEDITIHYQNVFGLILGRELKFNLKLTSSKDINNGRLVFISQKKGKTKYPLELKKNEATKLEYQTVIL